MPIQIIGGTSGVIADVDASRKALLVKTHYSGSSVGHYSFHSGALTVQQNADNGTSTGRFTIYNTVANTTKGIRIKMIHCMTQFTGAQAAYASYPRFLLSLFTYTGTITAGNTLTAPAGISKMYTAAATTIADARSTPAVSGGSITLGSTIYHTCPVTAPYATPAWSALCPGESMWVSEDPLLCPTIMPYGHVAANTGCGVVCWQADAGTGSETRRLLVDMVFEVFQ
jgi:hypothetical protein